MTKTYSYGEHHERMKKMAGHSDAKEDRKLVSKMVKKEALTGRAMGGPAPKGKGKAPKSQVNVLIAGKGGGDRPGMPPAPMAGGPAPMPAPPRPAVPVIRPAPVAATPGGIGGAGPIPAGVKRGGKVHKRANGGPLGASPEIAKRGYPETKRAAGGAVPRGANYNIDAKESKKAGSYNTDAKERKPSVRPSRELANVVKPKPMTGYDAGAGSGDGRLEKERRYGVKAKVRDRA